MSAKLGVVPRATGSALLDHGHTKVGANTPLGGLHVHTHPPRYPRILVCTRQRSTGVGERVWTARMCKQIQGGAQPLDHQLSSRHGPFRDGEPEPSTRQRVPCCLSVSVHGEWRSAFELSLTACIGVGRARATVSALA
jgi:hypothetical protein